MTGHLLDALRELGSCAGHIDTRDPRPVTTLGRLDLRNVVLGLRHAWQLHRLLGRQRDAVGVHISISQGMWGFLGDAVFAGVARLRRRRLYVHLHGGNFPEFYRGSSLVMRWLIRAVLGQAHQAWALTPTLRSQFDGLVPPERVRCIFNVVDDPLAGAPSPRAEEPLRDSALRILHLSNLLPEKGCFHLLNALALLGPASAGWEVRLVGTAPPLVERRLRAEIAALGEDAARVSLLGERMGEEKSAQYAWANVFVFPAVQPEGQPLVLLEALGAGLAIVAGRQPGIADTLREHQEGLLVAPADEQALAAALMRLSQEPNLRRSLSAAARARYEACYRPERLVSDLAALLGD